MNIIKEAKYVKTDIGENNNKFWYGYLYDNHTVRSENGRVGTTGDSHSWDHSSAEEAEKTFNKKCKEKEKKGYKKLDVVGSSKDGATTISVPKDVNLTEIAKKQIEHSDPEVTKLIERLSKANVHNILENTTMQYNSTTGLFTTPCGIVSKATIDKARELMSDMSKFIKKGEFFDKEYINLLQDYLMLIPQKVGRKLKSDDVFKDMNDVHKQNDILDSLEASLQTVLTEAVDKKDSVDEPKVFSVKLVKVDDSKTIDRIKKKFKSTLSKGHQCSHLDVKTVYTVEIESMKAAFDKKGKSIGNIMELWHGTRIFNVLSILKGGLHIPKSNASNVTGRMFGDGAYFSDISSKSLNYSYGYWDGGKRDDNCFMFMCDVAMGKEYIPSGSYESLPKAGYDSTFAKPGKSGIMNNEMIVYNLYQCNLTHLIEFSPGGK